MKCFNIYSTMLLTCALTGLVGIVLPNVGSAQTEEEPIRKTNTPATETNEIAGEDAPTSQPQVWTCPLHPAIRKSENGQCPICALELVAINSPPSQVWTCPFHPAIRKGQSGRCPICAMQLVAVNLPAYESGRRPSGLVSLQEMLSVALKQNPDVRASEAKLRSAEAELDQTKLQVVQKIIAYREMWQSQQASIRVAEQELVEAKRTEKLAKEGLNASKSAKFVAVANERLALERVKLAEIEAEQSFLLGTHAAQANRNTVNSRNLIQDHMLPKALQILKLRTQEYTTGKAQLREVIDAHVQILELELRLATSLEKKLAAVKSQQALLKEVHNTAQAKYRAGKAPQGDVLAIDLEISKVELKRMELLED